MSIHLTLSTNPTAHTWIVYFGVLILLLGAAVLFFRWVWRRAQIDGHIFRYDRDPFEGVAGRNLLAQIRELETELRIAKEQLEAVGLQRDKALENLEELQQRSKSSQGRED